jgi:hypothetical protein
VTEVVLLGLLQALLLLLARLLLARGERVMGFGILGPAPNEAGDGRASE